MQMPSSSLHEALEPAALRHNERNKVKGTHTGVMEMFHSFEGSREVFQRCALTAKIADYRTTSNPSFAPKHSIELFCAARSSWAWRTIPSTKASSWYGS